MRSFVLPALLPAFALAAPAHHQRDASPSPTLFTFTYDGNPVTATWYGTAIPTVAAPCPTMTFTYEGAVITAPYTGPGTPQSCLTEAPSPTAAPACPTMTFTYDGVVITAPYTGPGTPQSCLTPGGAVAPTTAPAGTEPASSAPPATQTSEAESSVPPVTSATSVPQTQASTSPATSTASPISSIAKGFNYGSSGMTQSIYETQFNIAKDLVGTSGFTSARLYTTIQDGTTNDPISAIPAAIATNTTLLLGLFYPNVDNELAALSAAIQQYGTAFTDLVIAISAGSEDLYRNSPTGIENGSNPGANPADIISFIQATRNAIAGTALSGKPVGHVDTWTAYVNGSNADVITNCDFLGVDAYPYYQNTDANTIENGQSLFESAYQATVGVAQGKPVWITETGWPASGPLFGQAVASTANAETYWQEVGCGFAFDKIPTWWYDLVDAGASPSFGVTLGTTTPLYDLTCSA
jgi:glucan endo-1,3-beta-D-glucosidase